QAEDGIRDPLVTGVQTCALPIYRRVGLDEVVVRAGAEEAALRAHDARGGGLRETERIADRQHPVAHLETLGVPERQRGERVRRLDVDESDVRLVVTADELRVELLLGRHA